jgi:crotonobetainyl-CoA:carnitine CoA-transferase CaiB-like acyl-CoA transferase
MNDRASPIGTFLSGVRILDLSQYISGPMATLILADMGAEVLKIEPPTGDKMQELGPRDAERRPIFYRALNAGKSVRRMDLKDPVQRTAFLELVCEYDVVVEAFRPGVMKRLGVDYPVLSAANPRIILCSISGYGTNTENAQIAGHDANYLAHMGVMHRNGNGTQAAMFYDPPLADMAGSLFGAIAILGALHGCSRSGRGCEIDLALADSLLPLQIMQIASFGETGAVPVPGGTYLNGGAAYYQTYRTADSREIVLCAVEAKFWKAFCEAAGRPDLLDRQNEAIPQDQLREDLEAIFGALNLNEAIARFGPADCCLTKVNDLGEAMATNQVRERRIVQRNAGDELQALLPLWVDGVPPSPRVGVRSLLPPEPESAIKPIDQSRVGNKCP